MDGKQDDVNRRGEVGREEDGILLLGDKQKERGAAGGGQLRDVKEHSSITSGGRQEEECGT